MTQGVGPKIPWSDIGAVLADYILRGSPIYTADSEREDRISGTSFKIAQVGGSRDKQDMQLSVSEELTKRMGS